MTATNLTCPGENADIDALFAQLGILEEREFDAIEFRRFDLLAEIRLAQIPIKREINKLEGFEIYDLTA
jgi:hypothetical protein